MTFHNKRAVLGLSLIELMVALAIGVLLLLGLVQVMAASRTAYQLSTGVARTQENARFAMDFLQRDLRMGGHLGCVNDQSRVSPTAEGINLLFLSEEDRVGTSEAPLVQPQYAEAPFPLRFDIGIQGFEANNTAPDDTLALAAGAPVLGTANEWSPSLPDVIAGLEPVQGSDIVVLRYFSPVGAAVQSFSATATQANIVPVAAAAEVSTENDSGLFAISDCGQASVFAATTRDATTGAITVQATGINESTFLGEELVFASGGSPPPQTTMYRAEAIVYYVGVRGPSDEIDADSQPSLYRARFVLDDDGDLVATEEELVEGVESLQLLYGLDYETTPSESPTGYISSSTTADTIAGGVANPDNVQSSEWRRVGVVQVGMLMRSSSRAASAQAEEVNAPSVLGVTMTAPNDGYYRSVYETTVAMRNRLFGN